MNWRESEVAIAERNKHSAENAVEQARIELGIAIANRTNELFAEYLNSESDLGEALIEISTPAAQRPSGEVSAKCIGGSIDERPSGMAKGVSTVEVRRGKQTRKNVRLSDGMVAYRQTNAESAPLVSPSAIRPLLGVKTEPE